MRQPTEILFIRRTCALETVVCVIDDDLGPHSASNALIMEDLEIGTKLG